jgi:hypothetical protein
MFRQIGRVALVSTGLCFAATAFGQAPAAQPVSPFTPRLSGLSLPAIPVSAHPAAAASTSAPSSAIKRLQVLGGKNAVEIEVEGSDRLVPQTQVLTGPDRLVIDFPNASPTVQLRNQSINRGEVKDVRVGLFHSNPPVTRVVVDLKSPQSFQIFPDRKSVIIKVTGKNQEAAQGVEDFPAEPVTRPGLLTTNYTAGAARVSSVSPPSAPPAPVLDVTFRNGMLSIKSTQASLSEILFAVHQRTGADVTLSAGAEQEKVAANIGPAPATEVLTRLLNGSKFNYLIVSSATDPKVLDKVILSPKAEGAVTPLPPMANNDMDDDGPAPPPIPQRAVPLGETSPAVMNAPPTNMDPQQIPQMNMSLPHATQPPQQPASTPPSDDNPPD